MLLTKKLMRMWQNCEVRCDNIIQGLNIKENLLEEYDEGMEEDQGSRDFDMIEAKTKSKKSSKYNDSYFSKKRGNSVLDIGGPSQERGGRSSARNRDPINLGSSQNPVSDSLGMLSSFSTKITIDPNIGVVSAGKGGAGAKGGVTDTLGDYGSGFDQAAGYDTEKYCLC